MFLKLLRGILSGEWGIGSQAWPVLAFGCAFDPLACLPWQGLTSVSCGILSEPRCGASSVALTAGVRPWVHPRLHYSVMGTLEYSVLLQRTYYTRGPISMSIVEMSIATPFIIIYIHITFIHPHGYQLTLSLLRFE